MTDKEVEDIFTYHAPTTDQAKLYGNLGYMFRELAVVLNQRLPEGPGKTVAIRKLAEARMQANVCIALEGRF